MNINTTQSPKFISIQYIKNDVPPPNYISKVVDNTTDDVIKQIPTESQIHLKRSMAENSIIDIYV